MYAMEYYKNAGNTAVLKKACFKMLQERYSTSLNDKELDALLEGISSEVENEYSNKGLRMGELNNITLSKIKQMYDNKQKPQESTLIPQQTLDDDAINHKLKELETRRQVIPEYSNEIADTEGTPGTPGTAEKADAQSIIYKPNPISITIPPMLASRPNYKSFIINSMNRDWCKNPSRNFINFNVSIDAESYTFYPHCLCLPSFVKRRTPYVLANITDGKKNVIYCFTCSQTLENWDTWLPIDGAENIDLKSKVWSVRLYDFTNNELDLGHDAIEVLEVSKKEGQFLLKISGNSDITRGDVLNIRFYNGRIVPKNALDFITVSQVVTINDSDNIVIDDFINAKIMVQKSQFSFIVKYNYTKQ